jgi:hypothetical protein
VGVSGRGSSQRDLLPGKGLELLAELLLIPFDDHDVVGAATQVVVGVLALGVHDVASHGSVGRGAQQGLEASDLVRLVPDVQLSEDQAAGVIEWGQQVDFAAAGPGGTAQALAVHCHRAPGLRARLDAAPYVA